MFVITRNGKTTVITGWRAWLYGAVAVIVAWLMLALIAFLFVGAAVTVGLFMLLAIPALALVALFNGAFNRRSM